MMRGYSYLLRLYPVHIREIYGVEMFASFRERSDSVRVKGRWALLRFLILEFWRALPDAVCERIAMLSSHPSFRGRRPRDFGVVRPPNAGKREWFYGEQE
jgi:hypothetical protein